MPDNSLYDDPTLAQFYDVANNGWKSSFDYCVTLAQDAGSILDLGCGTGELAAMLAKDKSVTGVDPARGMLDIARTRPNGNAVNWVQADARTVRLDQHFDLILLTGHTFQVFLETKDQQALLATIKAHLNPGGKFIFDTRNPDFDAPKSRKKNTQPQPLDHPTHGKIEAWNASHYDARTNILTYENSYRILSTGKTFSATAQILYTAKEQITKMITQTGLKTDTWLGDWDGQIFHPKAREIIPIGSLA